MRRHRTTAAVLLLAGLAARISCNPGERQRAGRRTATRLPARRQDRPLGQLRRPAPERSPRRHRHGEPLARARRRRRGREHQVLGVEPRRLHALPLRPERHDVHVHPPEQRPHRAERQQGWVQDGRHVCRPERREGHGRPADRLERRLGRRERKPAPPLRGAPERRHRRESVQVPEAGREAAVRRTRGRRVQPRATRKARRRPGPALRRSPSTACASTRVVAGSTSMPARWSFRSRSAPTSRRSASSRAQACAR